MRAVPAPFPFVQVCARNCRHARACGGFGRTKVPGFSGRPGTYRLARKGHSFHVLASPAPS